MHFILPDDTGGAVEDAADDFRDVIRVISSMFREKNDESSSLRTSSWSLSSSTSDIVSDIRSASL